MRATQESVLRAVLDLWHEHDGDLPQGAFSGMRMRTLEDAHERGVLRVLDHGGGDVAAAAFVQRVRARRPIIDFRGERVGELRNGDVFVSRFAGDPSWVQSILRHSLCVGRLWVQAWEENPRDVALVEREALTWQGAKIRSTSELVGVYAHGLPAASLPSLDAQGIVRVRFPYDVDKITREATSAALEWADHYSNYNAGQSWSAVSLRGYGDVGFIIKPSEMSQRWRDEHSETLSWKLHDTPLLDAVPSVRALLDELPGRAHRVRLMRLTPGGGELERHSDICDPDCGTRDGKLMRLHFPLVTNPGVVFASWDVHGVRREVRMQRGECWYLDTRKPHTARNDGDEDRVHLVIDVEASSALRVLVDG